MLVVGMTNEQLLRNNICNPASIPDAFFFSVVGLIVVVVLSTLVTIVRLLRSKP